MQALKRSDIGDWDCGCRDIKIKVKKKNKDREKIHGLLTVAALGAAVDSEDSALAFWYRRVII